MHFSKDHDSLFCSIVVNSLEWSKIRPNLPWLVDAGGCMFLDIFVSLYIPLEKFLSNLNTSYLVLVDIFCIHIYTIQKNFISFLYVEG